jgi:hypothetical protein
MQSFRRKTVGSNEVAAEIPRSLDHLVVPFPDLLDAPPRKTTQQLKIKRTRSHVNVAPTTDSSSSQVKEPTSVPISLPESHIQHTQSELELESMNLQAEHKDVQMYARLLFGMHDQMRRRVSASGKVDVHPLSRKSFDGIIKTKLANIRDLENKEVSARVRTDNLGWITSYNEHIAEKDETCSNHSLYNIIGSTEEVDDTEDDFIFNMEL